MRLSGLSEASIKRRFEHWLAIGVDGVSTEKSPGKTGWRYVATEAAKDAFLRGELPAPWESIENPALFVRSNGDPSPSFSVLIAQTERGA